MLVRIAKDFPIIHTVIGLVGNLLFFVGSILFFKAFEPFYTFAVWLFVIGSACMLVGSVGEVIRKFVQIEDGEIAL